MVVVSDTSAISNLIILKRLDLLQKLFSHIVIPTEVHKEILKMGSLGYDLSSFHDANWITVREPTDKNKVDKLLKEIDRGESEAIVLSKNWKPTF